MRFVIFCHYSNLHMVIHHWIHWLTRRNKVSMELKERLFLVTLVFLIYPAILRHSEAHFLHVWAHCLQCSIVWCFSHSALHASHMSAQILQIFSAYSLSLDMNWEAVTHMFAQSRHSWMHFAIIFTSSSRRHSVAQNSHASKQTLHAPIQVDI